MKELHISLQNLRDKVDTVKVLKDKQTRLQTKTSNQKIGRIIFWTKKKINIRMNEEIAGQQNTNNSYPQKLTSGPMEALY